MGSVKTQFIIDILICHNWWGDLWVKQVDGSPGHSGRSIVKVLCGDFDARDLMLCQPFGKSQFTTQELFSCPDPRCLFGQVNFAVMVKAY